MRVQTDRQSARASSAAREQLRALRRGRGAARAGAGGDGSSRRRHRSARARVVGDRGRCRRRHACSNDIYDFAGEEFNIGSPQQLGKILFGKLGFPAERRPRPAGRPASKCSRSRARVSHLRARLGVARSHEAQEHLRRRHSAARRCTRRPPAHRVQSDCDGDRPALVDESEPAEHSGSRRARTPDSARLRCARATSTCCSPPITVRSSCV